MIWHQCTIDIFFMDWERPKGILASNQVTEAGNKATPPSGTTNAPVSIWRTYFVANEWNEIQSLRKINHTLLLMLVLLFIQVGAHIFVSGELILTRKLAKKKKFQGNPENLLLVLQHPSPIDITLKESLVKLLPNYSSCNYMQVPCGNNYFDLLLACYGIML